MNLEKEDNINVAIMKDNLEEFIKMIEFLPNWENYFIRDLEEYFIHVALKNKSIKVLNFMFDHNLNLMVRDRNNKTPLHLAIEAGLCEIVVKILNSEILFSKDLEGYNELHKWVIYHSGCENCLKHLSNFNILNKNSSLTEKNFKGNNPLHQAIIDEDFNSVKMLIQNAQLFNFDLTELGENENSLLHFAAENKTQVIKNIINSLLEINLKNTKSQTALTISLIHENYTICEKLISLKARISSQDKRIAYEKSNKSLYSKLKQVYEEQHKNTKCRAKSFNNNPIHNSNIDKKSIVIINNDEEEIQKDFKNYSIKKTKISQDFKKIFKVNSINLDSSSNNSNNSIFTERSSIGSNTNILNDNKRLQDAYKKESDTKNIINPVNPINPFTHSNPFNKSMKDISPKLNIPFNKENSTGSNHSGILNVNSTSPNRNKNCAKGPIIATLSSNFFNLKNCNDNYNNPSHVTSSIYTANIEQIPKRFTNNNFNLDSYINFEFIKSFTNLDLKDIIKEELIYSAEICKVYKGKYLYLPVAIKEYNIAKLKEDDLKYFISEVNLLMSLRHPNIVTFIGTCFDKNDFYIVTEYLEKKSLRNVLENKKIDLNILDKLRICYDISVAILYLHKRKPQVFHRDLKSSNCLVDSFNKVKLCDFGLSKIYEELKLKKRDQNANFYQTNCLGTSFWMSPEFITDNLFTDKADIYAFGILIWEIMMRDPVPHKNISEMAFLCGDKDNLKLRPHIPNDFDPEIKELMELCWHMDYQMRPEISFVVLKLDQLIQTKK